MSQVSKIEEAILIALCNAEVSVGTGLIGYNFKLPDDALDKAKQALLSAILEVMPEQDHDFDHLTLEDVDVNSDLWFKHEYHKARNEALDEWEQSIKELFNGVEE